MTDESEIEITYMAKDNGEQLYGPRGKLFLNLETKTVTIFEPENGGSASSITLNYGGMRALVFELASLEKNIENYKGE